MRFSLTYVVAATFVLASLAGCKNGIHMPSLAWWKKNDDMAAPTSSLAGTPLPSQAAVPKVASTSAPYASSSGASSMYPSAAGGSGAPLYPSTGGGYPMGKYPSAGGYPSAGSYPSASTYPSAGSYPPAGGYPSTTGMYPSTANTYPSTANTYPATGSGQPSSGYPSTGYSNAGQSAYPGSTGYPTGAMTSTGPGYPNSSSASAAGGSPTGGAMTAQPGGYGTGGYGAGGYGSAMAATSGPGTVASSGGANGYLGQSGSTAPATIYPSASGVGYGQPPATMAATPPSPASAVGPRYADPSTMSGANSGNPGAGPNMSGTTGTSAQNYQPGNTGYQPGNTGYNPPNVEPYAAPAPYQMPGTATPSPSSQFRPGSTSSYTPATADSGSAGLNAPPNSYPGATANYIGQ